VTAPGPRGERAAVWLLRCYPRSWRARYGDEFTEVLLAEFAERPGSWRMVANVITAGLLARLSGAGLTSSAREPREQIRISLATLGCAVAAFLAFGGAIWAQLSTSAQWSAPSAGAARAALAIMPAAAAILVVLALLAALPLIWCAVVALAHGQAGELAVPAILVVLGAVAMIVGGHHFENAWPGTGGTAGAASQGLVPGGVAAFSWATTLSVSSYWAHLQALRSFPHPEIAWMMLSPLAWLGLAAGSAGLVRRLRPSARLLAYESRLAVAAAAAMAVFACGAGCWVLAAGSAAAGPFHAGVVDLAGLAAMTLALLAAGKVAAGAYRAALALTA